MKRIGIITVIVLALCILAFIISEFSGKQETSDVQDEVLTSELSDRQETSNLQDDVLTSPIKSYDEFSDVCSEEILSQSDNIKAAVDLKMTFEQKEFKELFSALVYGFVNEMPTSKLYNENGCYLSISSATFFDVASNQTSDVIQCFIFKKDLEEAGTIRFLSDKIETMSVSVNDSKNGGTSIILEKLAKDKDKKYVLLTNGTDTKLLDNENNIVNAGSSRHKLEIDGDCYSILEQKGLSISYSDIIDKENLIWIEF